jgi:hypothetical protein
MNTQVIPLDPAAQPEKAAQVSANLTRVLATAELRIRRKRTEQQQAA